MSSHSRVYHLVYIFIIGILVFALIWNIHNQLNITKAEYKQISVHDEIRVLCLVPYLYEKPNAAKYIKRTWGQYCNILVFVSGEMDDELEPYVPVINSTDNWTLVHRGLLYAYEYYNDRVDWFLKVEDYSFVVMENLRYLIQNKKFSLDEPIYFGYELEDIYTKKPFVYCKSGYVLSHEALRRYTQASANSNNEHCIHKEGFKEDLEISRCLRHVGVRTVDSRDEEGKETFLALPIIHQYLEGYDFVHWLRNMTYHKVEKAHTIPLSTRAISFRLDYPPQMFNYYYFVYKVNIFGLPNMVPQIKQIP